MKNLRIFGEGFLDGFTMAGFLNRLERPGAATHLCEPSADEMEESPWVFEIGAASDARVEYGGDLHSVPEPALRQMMQMLEAEIQNRRPAPPSSVQTLHGAS